MQDNDSIKNELQTLIMLEQQQAGALQQLNNKAGFVGSANTFGGLYSNNLFAGLYGPSTYGTVRGNDTFYDRAVNGVINSVNNVNASMRHAAIAANLDSSNAIWRNQTKMSIEARELQSARIGEKLTGGAMNALSLGGSLIGNIGGSIVGGLIGGAAVGVATDIAADQMKQNYAYDQYLLQNSYRFINMYESNNKRGVGGFSRTERWNTASFLRNLNTEMKISDEDTMTLLQKFTEGDLLREVDNVETFQKKMKELVKTSKTMMLTLNETFEEVADFMAEMKKKGIDTRNYQAYASGAKITGGLIGAEASEVLKYQMDVASGLTQGTSLSTDSMMNVVNSAQAYMGKIYDEALKNKDVNNSAMMIYNRIVNRGGVDGATSEYLNLTSSLFRNDNITKNFSAAFFDWEDGEWKFNRGRFNDFASGNKTIHDIEAQANANLNSSGKAATASWMANGAYYLEGALSTVTDRAKLLQIYTSAVRNGNSSIADFNDSEILSTVLGLFNGSDAQFLSDITKGISTTGEDYYNKMISASVAESFIQKANANRTGVGYAVKNWWGGVTDAVGDFVSPMAGWFNSVGEGIQDAWYGKNYYDVKKLWSNTDFSQLPLNNLDEKLADLEKTMNSLSDASDEVKVKMESYRQSLLAAKSDYDKVIQSSGDNQTVSYVSGAHLTDYKTFASNLQAGEFSISKNTKKGVYAEDVAAYFNEALGLGMTPTRNGRFSAKDEITIMQQARKKIDELVARGSRNLDVNETEMIDIYSEFANHVNPSFGNPATKIKGPSSEYGLVGGSLSDTKRLSKHHFESVDELKKNLEGSYEKYIGIKERIKEDFVVTDNEQAMEDQAYADYQYYLSVYNNQAAESGSQEAAQTMYGAFARMIGAGNTYAKNIEKWISDAGYDNLNSVTDKIKTDFTNKMFGNYVGTTITNLSEFSNQIINSEGMRGIGLPTEVSKSIIEEWGKKYELTSGGYVSRDSLKGLLNYVLNAAAGSGVVDAQEKEDRERKMQDDVHDIAVLMRAKQNQTGGMKEADYLSQNLTPTDKVVGEAGVVNANGSGGSSGIGGTQWTSSKDINN